MLEENRQQARRRSYTRPFASEVFGSKKVIGLNSLIHRPWPHIYNIQQIFTTGSTRQFIPIGSLLANSARLASRVLQRLDDEIRS